MHLRFFKTLFMNTEYTYVHDMHNLYFQLISVYSLYLIQPFHCIPCIYYNPVIVFHVHISLLPVFNTALSLYSMYLCIHYCYFQIFIGKNQCPSKVIDQRKRSHDDAIVIRVEESVLAVIEFKQNNLQNEHLSLLNFGKKFI